MAPGVSINDVPKPLEVKPFEGIPTLPIKRTARISVGGKVPHGRLMERNITIVVPSPNAPLTSLE